MKIQLWMRGRDKTGKVKVYRAITEEEFVQVMATLMPNDGKRPWEIPDAAPTTEGDYHADRDPRGTP